MSMSQIRPITAEDVNLIYAWNIAHNQIPIPAKYWPPTGLLWVSPTTNKPIMASWLFCTDGPYCYTDWTISAPGCDKIERRQALKALFTELYAIGKRKGYPLGMGLGSKKSLISLFEEMGFIKDVTDLTWLTKGL